MRVGDRGMDVKVVAEDSASGTQGEHPNCEFPMHRPHGLCSRWSVVESKVPDVRLGPPPRT